MALIDQLERLAAAGFQILPATDITTHYVFARGTFAALVERKDEGFGSIGGPGLLTDEGFAALVWRDHRAWFVRKSFQQEATTQEISEIRRFSRDLADALRP